MGAIPSSTTVYAQAYLTSRGRELLFNSPQNPRYKILSDGTVVDCLKIVSFSLGDPDVNYNISTLLASGDIPDLSGENENAVTGAKGRWLDNLISPGNSTLPSDDINTVLYTTSNPQITIDLSRNIQAIRTVYTQQLMTYIDGVLVSDGLYHVTPTSYGKNKVVNNELIIIIKEPVGANPGYRLRIFYPSTGFNYNKMTFQFEVGYVRGFAPRGTVTGGPVATNGGGDGSSANGSRGIANVTVVGATTGANEGRTNPNVVSSGGGATSANGSRGIANQSSQ